MSYKDKVVPVTGDSRGVGRELSSGGGFDRVDNRKVIAVMGMGYVGLTLSVMLAKSGFKVHGIEIDKNVVSKLKKGFPHFHEKGLPALLKQQQRLGNLEIKELLPKSKVDVYIISVGTPLQGEKKTPNINYIQDVVSDVGNHMQKGCLVILRSTVPVGTTREVVIPRLEESSGLEVGKDFSLSFAPERTIEGKALIELEENPQIIGGYNDESVALTSSIFLKLSPTLVNVSSLETAEMIKIIDNSYRDVRFGFANEIAMICEKLGLDAVELINAANIEYPRNSIPVPSPGVGGACLSKDPHILIDFAEKAGYTASLIKEGRNVNEFIPKQIVHRVRRKLHELDKGLKKSKIFIIGFAFKGNPETSDMRDSTTLWFLEALKEYADNIYGYDPVIKTEDLKSLGIKVCKNMDEGFDSADVVVFYNNHSSYKYLEIDSIIRNMNKPAIFFDAWRMFDKTQFDNIDDIYYMGVGL